MTGRQAGRMFAFFSAPSIVSFPAASFLPPSSLPLRLGSLHSSTAARTPPLNHQAINPIGSDRIKPAKASLFAVPVVARWTLVLATLPMATAVPGRRALPVRVAGAISIVATIRPVFGAFSRISIAGPAPGTAFRSAYAAPSSAALPSAATAASTSTAAASSTGTVSMYNADTAAAQC